MTAYDILTLWLENSVPGELVIFAAAFALVRAGSLTYQLTAATGT